MWTAVGVFSKYTGQTKERHPPLIHWIVRLRKAAECTLYPDPSPVDVEDTSAAPKTRIPTSSSGSSGNQERQKNLEYNGMASNMLCITGL